MPNAIVRELVQLESRLDNAIMFTVVQYIHAIVHKYASNAEIIGGGVVACGLRIASARIWPQNVSSEMLLRLVLLLTGQAVAQLIQASANAGTAGTNLFVIVQTATVLTSALILASALSKRIGLMHVIVERGLTVTMYIFADTIGNMINQFDFGVPPVLLGILCISVVNRARAGTSAFKSLKYVVQGLNVVAVNVLIESITRGRDVYTVVFLLVFTVLAADAAHGAIDVLDSVRDYAVWASARRISALAADSALGGVLSPVALVLVMALKQALNMQDSVLVHLAVLVAVNDVLRVTNDYASASHGLDKVILLFLYVLLLDTLRHVATPSSAKL